MDDAGRVLEESGEARRFHWAVELFVQAFLQLARSMLNELKSQVQAALAAKEFARAQALLHRVLTELPDDAGLHFELAFVEMNLERPEQAAEHLANATRLQPRFAEGWIRRGQVLLLLARHEEALPCFDAACQLAPRDARSWEGAAQARKALNRDFAGLLRARRELVALNPASSDAWMRLAHTYRSGDLAEEAAAAYQSVLQIQPDHLAARWSLFQHPWTSCFDDDQSIADFAARWDAGVAWFEALPLDVCDPEEIAQALLIATDYHLHYQPGPLLQERKRYAALVTRLAHAVWAPPIVAKRPCTARRRIGFVSAYFRQHSVMKVAQALVAALCTDDFEVMIYHLDNIEDSWTLDLKQRVSGYRGGTHRPEHWLAAIAQDAPDVLVYLDIGQHPVAQILPAYRLAPVQIAFWGHPITSGYPTIDWFVSADEVECPDAQDHYSERLYRLAGLGTCYAMPSSAAGAARDDGEVRFLLAQNILKINPGMDETLARIAAQVPQARFHVLPHPRTHVVEALRQRLDRAFMRHGLQADRFVRMQTHVSAQEFATLASSCALNLDTPDWSGGISTFDLLAQDLPTLTCPAETFRSRQSAALLRRLGLEALIVDDMDQYVSQAVAIAKDPDLRASLRQCVKERKQLVFDDRRTVDDWVRFITEVEPAALP